MPKQPMIPVAGLPAAGNKLTPEQWRKIERYLEEWKTDVMDAVRRHPARSFEAGRKQVEAFVNLLGKLGQVSVPPATVPVEGPTSREAQWWVERYTFHEIDDALNEYIGKVKDAILYGTRGAFNPTVVASALYKATKDSQVNWRAIARTESQRALAAGRLRACEQMGYDAVWCPPHAGACKSCRRLLENKVFPIAQVKDATNYGRKQPDWIACIPLHPHCRHVWLPYEPEVVDAAREHYRKMEEAGFTDDDRLDEMFDSSGQLNPEYESTDFSMFKTRQDLDGHVEQLYQGVLADAVSKCRTSVLIGKVVKGRTHVDLDVDRIGTHELYQREPIPEVVDDYAAKYRAGAPVPPVLVSKRADGTVKCLDGQHRILGAAKAGLAKVRCDVRQGLDYEDESRMCREAMGEAYPRPEVGKDFDRDAARRQRWETGKGHPDYSLGGHSLTELNAPASSGDPKPLRLSRQTLRGHVPSTVPGRTVTAYRAHHPDDPHGNALRAGDWIALNHDHAASLFPDYPIHAENVSPDHVTWSGGSNHEFIYRPPHFDDVKKTQVGKGMFDPEQAGLDPLLWDEHDQLRGEAYGRLVKWASHVLGHRFQKWAGLYLTGGATARQWLSHPERDSDIDLQIVVNYGKLRKARPEWREFSDADLHFAITALVKAALDQDVDEVMPGLRLDAFVRPEQSIAEFESDSLRSHQNVWSVLGNRWIVRNYDGDHVELYGDPWLEGVGADIAHDHADWVVDARAITDELERALREYDEDPTKRNLRLLREAYTTIHDLRKQSYAVTDGDVVDDASARADGDGYEGRGNFIWQYAVNFGPLMQIKAVLHGDLGKVFPAYVWGEQVGKMSPQVAPGTGVEHWITVHPHGPDEPGQPVLVRNNSDGSMTVIGGAGGSLNYLRLDKGRRIDDKKGRERGESADEKAKLTAEQPITEEERKQQEKEFADRQKKARALIERVQARKDDLQQQLRDYLQSINYDIGQKRITHTGTGEQEWVDSSKTEQRKALQRIQAAAVHTLAYGEIERKDGEQSPLIEERQGDFEGMEDEKKPDESEIHEPSDDNGDTAEPSPDVESEGTEQDLDQLRQKMPSLPPLEKDQAQTIMELTRKIARYGRQQSKARKVLRQGGEVSDSLALDWRDSDVKEEVANRVAQEVRTNVARDLMETAENPKRNPGRVRYETALRNGAYGSIDAFTNAVLGVSAITPEVGRLLGPAGTAQLAAHAIRKYGEEHGGVDTQKALDALEEHTQKQEQTVAQTALARARAASDICVQMREERKLSAAGQSLWLQSMTYSYEQDKMGEAARMLGMGIGGMEAASALKVALTAPQEHIKVGGFESAASIKQLATKAGLKITDADISRVGAGNYTLSLAPDRLEHLLKFDPPPNTALRDRLRKLRTPGQLNGEVEKARDTPGMTDRLDPMQARGKLVLTSTAQAGGGCVLAFAPGRGKTHTALAAALQRMDDENVPQGAGNTWIVCPTTAMAEWAGTIAKNSTRGVQMIGSDFTHLGGGVIESRARTSSKHKQGQLDNATDFNIIGIEQLQTLMKKNPELADKIKASRVITDESQKIKNPGSEQSENKEKRNRWQTLDEFAKHTTERWALSGTTVEKKLKDFGAQYRWANPGKSMSPAAMEEKFGSGGSRSPSAGKLSGAPHILGEDRIRQFREGVDEGLYQLGADDENLPGQTDVQHNVDLDPEHKLALQKLSDNINSLRAEAKERGLKGVSGVDAHRMMQQGLFEKPGNAIIKELADTIDKSEAFDFADEQGGGANAGTYEPKHIVFSQFVKQLDHVVDELSKGDQKVFYAHGGLSNEQNDKVLKDFLAHKGRAVLVSSDKNSTARSLQFGYNKGKFQNGATQLHHYSLPDNNATIQQRNARQHRKGAAVPVKVHTYSAGTPSEIKQQDRLEGERRTQQVVGNSEQLVGGRETLRRRLERRGQKPAAMQAADA